MGSFQSNKFNISDHYRAAYELRGALIVWNLLLASFSVAGVARTLPEFLFTLSRHGLYHSLCVPR